MDSVAVTAALPAVGCPIRRSSDQSLFSGSSKLIAASHVLHRLLAPRHPPYALSSLAINQMINLCNFENYRLLPYICNCQRTESKSWKTSLETNCFLPRGGGERNRTDDLLLAKQALSRLSYTPILVFLKKSHGCEQPLDGGPRKI
jgi:hypothetical protein